MITGGKDNEDLLGVVHVIDLLQQSLRQEPLDLQALVRQPLVLPGGPAAPLGARAVPPGPHPFAFVVDEFGSVEGIVTLSDVMETIAGNLPNEVERSMPGTIFSIIRTVRGRSMAICRWRTWCSTFRCRWMINVSTTPSPVC